MALHVHAHAAAKRRYTRRRLNGPVTVTRVDPQLHAEALEAAGGDPARFRILGPGEVDVLNQPRGGQL